MLSWVRPKDLQQHYHESQKLFATPDAAQCETQADEVLTAAFHPDPATQVAVQPYVLQDAQLTPWFHTLTAQASHGTRLWLSKQLHHPIHAIPQLKLRQNDVKTMAAAQPLPEIFTEGESAVLWALRLPPVEKAWPLPLLFPQWFALRWINHQPQLLNLYQLYRIYGAPLSHLLYPLTLLLGPWWYIRTKLKWNLPFVSYLSFIKKALVELVRFRTGTVREVVIKLTTLVVYVGLYIYGILQTVDIALLLRQARQTLLHRMKTIQTFLTTVESHWVQSGLSLETWSSASASSNSSSSPASSAVARRLPDSIQGMYRLFQSNAYHATLQDALVKSYTLQGLSLLATAAKHSRFAFVQWRRPPITKPVAEWSHMGHPMLPATQQTNPVSLQKNLILTGPNAAGKSTYVRGILGNLLLAQTFGVMHARKAIVSPVHTIASFMRVQDIVGTQSLFEAECRRSMTLIDIAKQGRPVLFFLDEPMNATPPTEGAATAMALIQHLATFPNVRLIATTHYHLLAELETADPKRFRNIHMDALLDPIRFSYQLKPGPSFQSIAIELLKKDAFPESLLNDAIKIKNKICRVENNTKP